MMLNKIRLNLTLINSIVLAAVLIFTFIFVYIIVDINITSNTNSELCENAYQLKRYISLAEAGSAQSYNPELYDEFLIYEHKMLSSSGYFSIWDSDNNCILSEGNVNVPEDILASVRRLIFTYEPKAERIVRETDGTYYIHAYTNQTTNIRICTTVFVNDSGQMRIAQIVSNMHEKKAVTSKLLNVLLMTGLLGVSVSFGVGYLLSGRSIIPIQQSIKRQNEFIADASHELRTPITIVRTNLDVVISSEEESVSSQMEWLENAYIETERMEKLINDLLLLAKSDLNQEKFVFAPVSVDSLCKKAVKRFESLAAQKNIVIRIDTDEAFDGKINGDENKLDQMLGIILDNAITYSHGSSHIYVRAEETEESIKIFIKDEGIGIDSKELENIFERFYRTDKARSRREGGTGLGLAIAKWIAEAHGGNITAESEKNKGTTIITSFPKIKDI